jgi:hypothetical protein
MKLHKNIKIESAASKDAARKVITETYLDITDGKGQLVATDGRILAAVPVEIEPGDVAGYVSAACLKAARKLSGRSDTASVGLNGAASFADGSTMPRTVDNPNSQYPNWRQVVAAPYETPAMVIRFDALLLWNLAQAMGTQGVCLTIAAPDEPIQVTPNSCGPFGYTLRPACDDARGVIMPISASAKP